MTQRATIRISEVRHDGSSVYYRVLVNGVEKSSLVFVRAADRTAHGEADLKEWCERNVHKLDSGKVIEAYS